ncbi:PTS glucitol/sorbitol transporter subunit IIA [Gilliamella sp. G0441]|uniref:PTS glucitol/sorbitol transporter subunit IIA n=2 Tax=Gilliamella TaxID=1193503 RepID=UPI0025D4684E|nr:PTS glucitol/sorbitol transporter subunit IIA [uncultured Gilliamella sp.]
MMSKIIYYSKIRQIGDFAKEALADGMLILFNEGAPSDLADYCFIHSHGELRQNLKIGQCIQLGKHAFQITSVGDVATTNFKELGHITLKFDGNCDAELPGTVHVVGEIPNQLNIDDEIIILTI